MKKLKTAQEARSWFTEQGLSVAEWARQNGFGKNLVHNVLSGNPPCLRGHSHQIAVLLGMKNGVITRPPAAAHQRGPHTTRNTPSQAVSAPGSDTQAGISAA